MRHGQPVNTVHRRIHGNGNTVAAKGALLHDVTIDICGDNNAVLIGPRCMLRGVRIRIRGDSHRVSIGAGCVFSEGSDLWLEDSEGTITIGAHTTIVNVQLAVTETGSAISIGEDCLFAYGIEIRTGDSHPILDRETGARLNPAADVTIGNHVWVTTGCTLLKGSGIPDGCVVGAGSIVTHQFGEPDTVIAGDPAKIVRRGIRWQRERIVSPPSAH